jgi:hypothetical protein
MGRSLPSTPLSTGPCLRSVQTICTVSKWSHTRHLLLRLGRALLLALKYVDSFLLGKTFLRDWQSSAPLIVYDLCQLINHKKNVFTCTEIFFVIMLLPSRGDSEHVYMCLKCHFGFLMHRTGVCLVDKTTKRNHATTIFACLEKGRPFCSHNNPEANFFLLHSGN